MNTIEGPAKILELGPGLYSTPLLVELCRVKHFEYLGVDIDPEWLAFSDAFLRDRKRQSTMKLNSWEPLELHRCLDSLFVPSTETVGRCRGRNVVVFIDQFPDESRLPTLRFFKEQLPTVIVCHDTSPNMERRMRLSHDLARFKYSYTYDGLMPWTTAVSDVSSLGGLLSEQHS